MRTRILISLGALVAAAALVGVTPAPASAACSDSTTFSTTTDGSTIQTYRRCPGSPAIWVTPYYTAPGGALHVFDGSCKQATAGAPATWTHPGLNDGATYSTAGCFGAPSPTTSYTYNATNGIRECWTTFKPTAPRGGLMVQFYANCSRTDTDTVGIAWRSGGGLMFGGYCQLVWNYVEGNDVVSTAVWNFPSTVPTASYTTVFCAGEL